MSLSPSSLVSCRGTRYPLFCGGNSLLSNYNVPGIVEVSVHGILSMNSFGTKPMPSCRIYRSRFPTERYPRLPVYFTTHDSARARSVKGVAIHMSARIDGRLPLQSAFIGTARMCYCCSGGRKFSLSSRISRLTRSRRQIQG